MVDVFEKAKVKEVELIGDKVKLNWADDHTSHFDLKFILDNSLIREAPIVSDSLNLWDGRLSRIPTISRDKLKFEDFAKELFTNGFVTVSGVEGTAEATEQLCNELVPVHDTFFGTFWTFSNDRAKDTVVHEDTAYESIGIGPHTDGTYFDQTPGIQVFHCLRAADKGGDTILVDALNCATLLRNQNPEYFDILTKVKIEHSYLEGVPTGSKIHVRSAPRPVIELDEYGNVFQIRFNPLDRSPMRCLSFGDVPHKVIKFYEAYEAFARLCSDAKSHVRISLQPGTVVFIDNFRVLHARTEFEGYRQMCGCYLSRDNFLAKARPFLPASIRDFV